ncbi:MAG: DUF429 domain-containing protein [Dehalococcoidia bacterium]|nr:MAG: DUF429 domain-containing protein [Dehalococcoidia bacterium]
MTNAIFIGLDLSIKSPSARAILNSKLVCVFDEWEYCVTGASIIPPNILDADYVLAIDGPQGLAGNPNDKMRECERRLGAAGKSPYVFPQSNRPFAGFVSASIRLFYSLYKSGDFHLYGIAETNISDTNLIEVYPGATWRKLAKEPIPKKRSLPGRQKRYQILLNCGVHFGASFSYVNLPTHDQLDAALAAYIAYLFRHNKTESKGREPSDDADKDVLREGFIIHLP